MSAFMCSNLHITTLARLAVQVDPGDSRTAEEFHRLFWDANANSVAYRYDEEPVPYEPMLDRFAELGRCDYVRAVHCSIYQSCEAPGWGDDEVALFFEKMILWLGPIKGTVDELVAYARNNSDTWEIRR